MCRTLCRNPGYEHFPEYENSLGYGNYPGCVFFPRYGNFPGCGRLTSYTTSYKHW